MLSAALQYAALGYPVFPCAPDKSPLTPHGFKDATTGQRQVEVWWEENIGAGIGTPAAGMVVIDVDLVDGQPNPWPGERIADFGTCPTARTPRGGWHFYFRRPEGVEWGCSASKIAPGVDVRTDGGYVLLAPSVTQNGSYRWLDEQELRKREDLPDPPAWLKDLLDGNGQPTNPFVAASGEIPLGERNTRLTSLAGYLRQIGLNQGEITATLHRVNVERCKPGPLPADEIDKIAWSIARKEPDQFRSAAAWDDYGHDRKTGPKLRLMTSAEFDETKYSLEYLVDGFLVANQPAVLGAPKKTLKTMVLEDLGISLASGTSVLGQFRVQKPVPVLLLSGESGGSTLQRNARTIAGHKGVELRNLPLFWSLDLPQLHHQDHMNELDAAIRDNGIRFCAIDPLYLCLLGGNSQIASNVYAMGEQFRKVGEIGQKHGCTLMLVHHFKSLPRDDRGGPPTLDDLSFAGISEFVRQWVLLKRRKRYDGAGHHHLWLTVGGSAGHHGLWRLFVDEGVEIPLAGGQLWKTTIEDGEESEEDKQAAKEKKTKEKADDVDTKAREAIHEALADVPNLTKNKLREATGINTQVITRVLKAMVDDEAILMTEKQLNNGVHVAYKNNPDR